MSLQMLPSPYEVAGGGNPYYDAAGNIAGLSAGPNPNALDQPGDYDRYLQSAAPYLAGLEESSVISWEWPVALATAAYGFMRTGHSFLGLAAGFALGLYMPRATPVALALDALWSHADTRDTVVRYTKRR